LKQNDFKIKNLEQQLTQKDKKLRDVQLETRQLECGAFLSLSSDFSILDAVELKKKDDEIHRLEKETLKVERLEQERQRLESKLKQAMMSRDVCP
jgi:hypothetical protein